jgi:hypothetical protein
MAWLVLTTIWHAKSSAEATKCLNTHSESQLPSCKANEGHSDHVCFVGDRAVENSFRLRNSRPWFWVSFVLLSVCGFLALPDKPDMPSETVFSVTGAVQHLFYNEILSQAVDCCGRNIEPNVQPSEQFSDNGRTKEVQWDSYSLIVKGQRIFLQYVKHSQPDSHIQLFYSSGEFHTFRLPVPSLWPDILQKIKAAGLNAISVYTHMGLINPSRGVLDFHGFRTLRPLFDAAKETGLWIVLRPGVHKLNLNAVRFSIEPHC